jgi:hypothetical protein
MGRVAGVSLADNSRETTRTDASTTSRVVADTCQLQVRGKYIYLALYI